MTTELQEAPVVDGIEDIPEMEAHVYTGISPVAHCGLPLAQDPHAQRQLREGTRYRYELHDTACGHCGAPVCAVCLSEFRKRNGVTP